MEKEIQLPYLLALTLTVLLSGVILAKDAPQTEGAPVELLPLAWTVGVWDTTAICRFAPDAPAVEARSIETIRWSANRQFLISDQLEVVPNRQQNKVVITTWNPVKREYDLTEVSTKGEVVKLTMVIEDGAEKVLCYRPVGDRLVRTEFTIQRISAVEYKFSSDCTDHNGTWRFCEGTSKKRQ